MKPDIKSPRVHKLIKSALNKRDLSYTDFVRLYHSRFGPESVAQNHMYKLLNGSAFPGENNTLPRIAHLLGINEEDLVRAVREDKLQAKGYDKFLPKFTPRENSIMGLIQSMNNTQQDAMLAFAKTLLKV